MGGRGSSSGYGTNSNGGSKTGNVTKVNRTNPGNMSTKELYSERDNNDLKIKAVKEAMDTFAKDRDIKTTEMPRGYYRARTTLMELQVRNTNLTVEIGRRRTGENKTVIPKTFVNSFGEATSREITSSSYKRALETETKAVLKNMGY